MRASSSTLASMASATANRTRLRSAGAIVDHGPCSTAWRGGAHGGVDVGGVALGDLGERLAGGRVLGGEAPRRPAASTKRAIDEQAGAQVEVAVGRDGGHGGCSRWTVDGAAMVAGVRARVNRRRPQALRFLNLGSHRTFRNLGDGSGHTTADPTDCQPGPRCQSHP